jgi:YD repeat-containing protein
VIETRTASEVVYTLDNRGYPLRAERSVETGETAETYIYSYENCRLVLRRGPPDQTIRTYAYDAEGHMVTINNGGVITTYDYGCW